ncbi:hypothetical protein D3C81_1602460 [compost metagenome]
MLLLPLAAAPAPPATASVPVALGFDRLLVLFTWNMPSLPFWILVTSPSTLFTVSLTALIELSVYLLASATAPSSCRRLTASVASLASATLLIVRVSPVAALPTETVPTVALLALEYLPT